MVFSGAIYTLVHIYIRIALYLESYIYYIFNVLKYLFQFI
jgi:hypothetical protein